MPFRVFSAQGITNISLPVWSWYYVWAYYMDIDPFMPEYTVPDWPATAQGIVVGGINAPISWGRPMSISGSSHKHAIEGYTLDSDESPVSGATVNVFRTSDNVLVGSSTSDANGRYAVVVSDASATYYAIAYKAGTTDIAGTTVNTLPGE